MSIEIARRRLKARDHLAHRRHVEHWYLRLLRRRTRPHHPGA
jgi:hypothetical protein